MSMPDRILKEIKLLEIEYKSYSDMQLLNELDKFKALIKIIDDIRGVRLQYGESD